MGYTVGEVLQFVQENDVKFIRLAFCDLFGIQKNISIMPGELKKAFEVGKAFDGAAINGFEDSTHSDLFLVPDPSTLNILPWRPQQGRVIRFYCYIKNPDGTDFEYDSRRILRNAIKRCNDMGYGMRMSEESEFYLFLQDENGNKTNQPFDHGTYLDVAPSDKGENIRREICLCLEEMGIMPESSHHENGPGQNEIVFKPSDVLSTADNLLTFKNVVSNIANRNGLCASFMPKPIKNKSGNGLHINMSLYKNGINLFDADEELIHSFMAGIMKRIREITLFLNPIPNSYERFGEFEAPKYVTWSKENRCQLIRIPEEKGDRRRIELRSPDSCINPYLAFALILHAGLDGMSEHMTLTEAVNYKLYGDMSNTEMPELLPSDFAEAVELAKGSSFIPSAIGDNIAKRFIETKENCHGECFADM